MNDPLLSLFGIARRASKLAIGHEAVKQAILLNKAKAVYISADISPHSARDLSYICENNEIPMFRLEQTTERITAAVGQKTGTVALCDNGFAKKALQLQKEECHYDD